MFQWSLAHSITRSLRAIIIEIYHFHFFPRWFSYSFYDFVKSKKDNFSWNSWTLFINCFNNTISDLHMKFIITPAQCLTTGFIHSLHFMKTLTLTSWVTDQPLYLFYENSYINNMYEEHLRDKDDQSSFFLLMTMTSIRVFFTVPIP